MHWFGTINAIVNPATNNTLMFPFGCWRVIVSLARRSAGGEVTKFQIKQIKVTGLISKSTTLYPYNFFGYNVVELPSSSHRWRDICHCNLMWRTSTHDKLHRPLTTSVVFSKMLQWRELLNWASNDVVYGVKYHTLNSHFECLWCCY